MPIPSSIEDLSQTPGSNPPMGSESPITADDYFRVGFSYDALHRDGKGYSAEVDVTSAATCDVGAANSSHTHSVSSSATVLLTNGGVGYGVNSGSTETGSAGGAETRPRNVALLACIKF